MSQLLHMESQPADRESIYEAVFLRDACKSVKFHLRGVAQAREARLQALGQQGTQSARHAKNLVLFEQWCRAKWGATSED